MLRRFALLVTFSIAAIVVVPGVAAAHAGATVTVFSDGRGSVWMTSTWVDGHPVTEPMTVTFTATPSGEGVRIGPEPLRQAGDARGTHTYSGALAPGAWQVVFELGAPVEGRCQALVRVVPAEASPVPLEVACLIAGAAAGEPTDAGTAAWLWVVAVVTLVAAVIGYMVLRARRP